MIFFFDVPFATPSAATASAFSWSKLLDEVNLCCCVKVVVVRDGLKPVVKAVVVVVVVRVASRTRSFMVVVGTSMLVINN